MLILNYSWAVWLAWLLAAFFVISGVLNLVGFKPMQEQLLGWGFPSWFRFVNGICDLLIGALIAWYPTRVFGLALGVLLCAVIWIVLLRHRDYGHMLPSVVLFALLLVTAWGLRLI
jgi:hypothetical protein